MTEMITKEPTLLGFNSSPKIPYDVSLQGCLLANVNKNGVHLFEVKGLYRPTRAVECVPGSCVHYEDTPRVLPKPTWMCYFSWVNCRHLTEEELLIYLEAKGI